MNNGQYNSQNGGDEKEEIRFDESDFQNQYSQYYSQYNGEYTGQSNAGGEQGNNYDPGYDYGPEPIDFSAKAEDPYLEQVRKTKGHFSKIGLGYALFSGITLTVSSIIAVIASLIDPDILSSYLFLNLLTPVSLYVFALPVLLIVLSGVEAKAPEKRKMKFGSFLLIIAVSFGWMYIGSYIGTFFMSYISELMGYDYGNALNSIIDGENIWITAIFTVIVAPIGEEIVFRKLIIDRTQKFGPAASIVLSALMFALMHGNFYQFFYCFALGLILGYIYYTTGKLHLTILLHAIINFVGGVLTTIIAPYIDPVSEWLENADITNINEFFTFASENYVGIILTAVFLIFVMASMACAIIFPLVFRKKIKSKLIQGEEQLPRGRAFGAIIRNAGMIIMFIIYFVELGLNLIPV